MPWIWAAVLSLSEYCTVFACRISWLVWWILTEFVLYFFTWETLHCQEWKIKVVRLFILCWHVMTYICTPYISEWMFLTRFIPQILYPKSFSWLTNLRKVFGGQTRSVCVLQCVHILQSLAYWTRYFKTISLHHMEKIPGICFVSWHIRRTLLSLQLSYYVWHNSSVLVLCNYEICEG